MSTSHQQHATLIKPFLKWAGNKFTIVKTIEPLLPSGSRLIEPFAGSGAVFLNTAYPNYLLTDINPDLIALYTYLQQEGDSFIQEAKRLFTPENNQAERFYELRTQFNTIVDSREKAMLFVYLNKHCYNGLCRYNAKQQFNVPFGRYKKPYFPVHEMQLFHQKAQHAQFQVLDFEKAMLQAKAGDVVYCDPPYVPLSKTAQFTSYSHTPFDTPQQTRLAELAETLSKKGITVLISNHNTSFTQQLYANATITELKVSRTISCKGSSRKQANEVLALFKGNTNRYR